MSRTTETNSLEVRWFGTGFPPRELEEWIAEVGPVRTSTRTDLYLSPLDPGTNLKLRSEGDEFVEVKRRLATLGRHDFGPDVTGTVEQWYKWSFPLAGASELREADRTGLWLPVEKTRTLSAVDRDAVGPIDDDHVGAGTTVHVEVTRVEVGGEKRVGVEGENEIETLSETAWTCGLEAAGPPAGLEGAFETVGAALFGEGFPLSLSADRSIGYVEWLRRITSDGAPASGVLVTSDR
jgi:hypothetical protein